MNMRMLDRLETPMRTSAYWLAVVGVFAVCAVALHYVSADKVVEAIGVENTYLVILLFGVFAGFSGLTGGSFYAAAAAFALGGANPILLGILGGLGLFVSDSIFYHVALRGIRYVRERRWSTTPERVAAWVNAKPEWAVLASVYAYAAFVPFPSDIMLAALAISDYEYKKFWPYLLAGDLTIVLGVASLAYFGLTSGIA